MEGTQKRSKSSKTVVISSCASAIAPWLDLPDGLTDLVLERLNLRDYLRFAAVCRKWRSIQSDHRLRHSPGTPPMAPSLPWTLSYFQNGIPSLSLFDSTLNRIPFHNASISLFSPSRGWLFVITDVLNRYSIKPVYLFNPITGSRVLLPSLSPSSFVNGLRVLSAPPTDPDCVALIICRRCVCHPIWVCRVRDHGEWITFPVSQMDNSFTYGHSISAIFCVGKFYCFAYGRFMVIDPLFPSPLIKTLDMDCPAGAGHLREAKSHCLVESNGEVLMVVVDGSGMGYDGIQGFRVFRADFSKMTWVMMEGLGDRVLFVDEDFAFCLSTAEVGCKKNLIYYTYGHRCYRQGPPPPAWRVFEMDTRVWIDGPSFSNEVGVPFAILWFMPSLEYVHPL